LAQQKNASVSNVVLILPSDSCSVIVNRLHLQAGGLGFEFQQGKITVRSEIIQ